VKKTTGRFPLSIQTALPQDYRENHPFISDLRILRELDNPFVRLLPDTFHMNIEETDGPAALKTCAGLYDSVHVSDNNRYFPGFGAFRFAEIITTLKDIGFEGTLGIEGNIKSSFSEDVRASAAFLAPLIGLQAAPGQG